MVVAPAADEEKEKEEEDDETKEEPLVCKGEDDDDRKRQSLIRSLSLWKNRTNKYINQSSNPCLAGSKRMKSTRKDLSLRRFRHILDLVETQLILDSTVGVSCY